MTNPLPNLLIKASHYILSYVTLCKDDIILASYPKSGSTWVRYFLYSLFEQQNPTTESPSFQSLNIRMPEFGSKSMFHDWLYHSPRLIKSHLKNGFYFNGIKKVLIVRDPKDVMVSYFHYTNSLSKFPHFKSFSAFIRDSKYGLPNWFGYWESWKNQHDHLIKYENLQIHDQWEFKKLLNYLKINHTDEELAIATQKSRFKNMRSIEENFGIFKPKDIREKAYFTRKGQVGDYTNYFSENDIRYYNHLSNKNNFHLYPDTVDARIK